MDKTAAAAQLAAGLEELRRHQSPEVADRIAEALRVLVPPASAPAPETARE